MSGILKILAVILVLLYLLSPVDLLPDVLPVLGRGDDLFLLVILGYYLIRGRLPGFLQRLIRVDSGRAGNDSNDQDAGPSEDPKERDDRDPYQVLGLERGASIEHIKEAYRRCSQQYHPDKVAHLGPELQELANRKFIEIQKAYEKLRADGG